MLPKGDALWVGERLHQCLEACINGQWVRSDYYFPCLAILHALEELDMVRSSLRSELCVSKLGYRGRIDIHGLLADGRVCIVEIKATVGPYLRRPKPAEVIQMGCYAALSDAQAPRLACVRISLPSRRLGVFIMDISPKTMQQIRRDVA
ncbi:hypothetical protein [Cerasicoccus fimbriatus]|uniref:hypothetical protein n=1 Tax=Cerasicoccus fimbriatus TaxID=3014554 RepID=UPI0022B4F0B7|nr:hypothetical protein [Cerasicoccus sp. TK19100]